MKTTSMDIRSQSLKKAVRGYDRRDVEAMRDLAADAIEDYARENTVLEEKLKDTMSRLQEHMENEAILKNTITSAQKMVDDLKANARKESELIVAEARGQADSIVKQAHDRAAELQDEIYRLKKQRIELETSLKALLSYHSSTLIMEEDDSKKSDIDSEKLKFFKK